MTTRAALLGLAACGGTVHAPAKPADDRVAIVASERGSGGVRLVAIDERGDRRFDLLQPAAGLVATRDANPAVSPDGAWIVFASTRDRTDGGTSLWIAPLGVETTPHRLTAEAAIESPGCAGARSIAEGRCGVAIESPGCAGARSSAEGRCGVAIDAHPAWRPDGRAIVFASTRKSGDFDLYELAIERGRATGAPVELVVGPGHQVTPSVARDGAIAYAVVTPTSATEVESHLEERAQDGTIRRLTDGPADSSPAYSPDGGTIAFTRPMPRERAADADLFTLDRASGQIAHVVDLPLTNEGGPVWSPDGRFLFATSVLKAEDGIALFSSVVHVDLREKRRVARILEDSAGANVRLTPAIAGALDATALHADPEYLPELAKIMAKAIAERTKQ